METGIYHFTDEYQFLSNFYEHPIFHRGLWFRNSEAAYQADKCRSKKQRKTFCNLTAGRAKRAGRRVQLREDWDTYRLTAMRRIIRTKFSDPGLRAKLLATGKLALVEGNFWNDRFWGVCDGEGLNHLGIILMRERKAIRKGKR